MPIPNTTVIELLKNAKKLTPEQLTSLETEATNDKSNLEELVVQQNITTDVELTQLFANLYIYEWNALGDSLRQLPLRLQKQENY